MVLPDWPSMIGRITSHLRNSYIVLSSTVPIIFFFSGGQGGKIDSDNFQGANKYPSIKFNSRDSRSDYSLYPEMMKLKKVIRQYFELGSEGQLLWQLFI